MRALEYFHANSSRNRLRTDARYPTFECRKKSGKRDSNPRPQPWQGCALPTELFPQTPAYVGRPGGGEGNRTPDLLNAIQALSQLSYTPRVPPNNLVRPCWLNRAVSPNTADVEVSPIANRQQKFRAGTTIYSRGYIRCQEIRAGGMTVGRYFARRRDPRSRATTASVPRLS